MSEMLTIVEHAEAMTGYDEQAVGKKFGADFDDLTPTMQLRSLVFLDIKRSGVPEADAYKRAMEMPIKEISIGTYFAAPEPEADDEQPEGEQGKDDSQPG